jgi:hypothetical protein
MSERQLASLSTRPKPNEFYFSWNFEAQNFSHGLLEEKARAEGIEPGPPQPREIMDDLDT